MHRTPLEPWIKKKIGLAENVPLRRSALEHYQLMKLQETLAFARVASPFYRRQLADYAKVPSLRELSCIPFTLPADLQEDERRFLCVSPREIQRVVTLQTSGTTASPKRLHFTAEDLERTIDFFHHGMATLVQPGDKVLILMPGELPGSVGDLLKQGLARMDVEGIVHGVVRHSEEVIARIIRTQVNCLVGIPLQLLALARHPDAALIPSGHLKSVLLSADYIPHAVVRELTHSWGAAVFSHYGMTEMGLGGGVECALRCGYHLREADLLVEIIDPANGAPRPDGETGEVVFTTLTRKGMPLIRYRTGDLARFHPESCPCGSVLRRLDRVTGRIAGTVHLGAEHMLNITDLDEQLLPLPFILNYQAVITAQDGVNCLSVKTATTVTDPDGAHNRQVHRALLNTPALRRAVAAGFLHIGCIRPEKFLPVTGIKRSIIDQRKESTC